MTNWSLIAEALHLGIPAEQLAAISPTLNALESAFRPLVRQLDPSVATAITYVPPAGERD